MSVAQLVGSLAEYEKAVTALKPIRPTHIKLYRGQQEEWKLLPNLFRKYRTQVELIHSKEREALEKLKNRVPWNTSMRPQTDWDWLSFGQHYGLLTTMLDWSASPMTALFFGVCVSETQNVSSARA
jgi:FRG domain